MSSCLPVSKEAVISRGEFVRSARATALEWTEVLANRQKMRADFWHSNENSGCFT